MEQASRPDFTNPLLTGSCFRPVPQPAGDRHWMKRVRCLCVGGSSPAASVGKGWLHVGLQAGKPCTWGPECRGLLVLEEHLPTSHLLSEGPGSKR